MLMQELTLEMVETWKSIYDEYKTQLYPNRKTALEVIEYLKRKYPVTEVIDDKWKQVVVGNVLLNECFAEKLPAGRRQQQSYLLSKTLVQESAFMKSKMIYSKDNISLSE